MEDEEPTATLDEQFVEFAKFQDNMRDGLTITLYRQDYWMRQAKVLDDRKLTMTDTGVLFFRLCKTEINFTEWYEFLTDLCRGKEIDQELVKSALTNCGTPGSVPVEVPEYATFFDDYDPKARKFCARF